MPRRRKPRTRAQREQQDKKHQCLLARLKIGLYVAGILCLLAVTSAFIVVDITAIQAQKVVGHLDQVATTLNTSVTKLNGIEDQAQVAVSNLADATGDWSDAMKAQIGAINQIETDVRATVWQVNHTLAKGGELLDTTKEQLTHIGPLLDSFKTASDKLPGTMEQMNKTVASAQVDLDDIHAKLTDPATDALLTYFRDTAQHVDSISATTDKKWKALVDPAPCTGRFCWAKTTWSIVFEGARLAEPAYYTDSLINNLFHAK